MKKEILNRIKQLGGNVANVKGVSLQDYIKSRKIHLGCLPKIQNRLKVWAIGWMRTWNYSILTEKHFIRKWLIPTIHWTKNLVGNYFG